MPVPLQGDLAFFQIPLYNKTLNSNPMLLSKILPTAIVIAIIISGFSGCSADPKSADPETPREVSIHIDAEPDRLMPMLTTSNYARTVFNGIFSFLLVSDPESVDQMIPQLAKSRPIVKEIEEGPYKGGIAYTFEIWDEAVWDDGSPVTGEDYIFTLKSVFNPKVPASAYRVYLSFIKDVELNPNNPKQFTVYTNRKYIIGEEAVSSALPVLPAYHYDAEGLLTDIPLSSFTDEATVNQLAENDSRLQDFATQFASQRFSREPEGISGCGTYRLVSWETGQRIVLERKKDWWGDKVQNEGLGTKAYPERIVFRPITDSNTALAAVRNGTIDVMSNIPPKQFIELQENNFIAENFNFFTPPSLVNTFVYLNTRIPKLQEKQVRKALAYSIDAEEIINTVFYGQGERNVTPIHPSFSYYNKELPIIKYDPQKAIALLEEAGWKDSNNNGIADRVIDGELTELSLKYFYTAGRPISESVALLIQEAAKRGGFDIQLVPQEFSITQEALKRREYELAGGAKLIQAAAWEPKQDFHSEGDDRTGFATPVSDSLIDVIQLTIDKTEREKLYQKLQEMIYDEMPIVYLMAPTGRLAVNKNFEPIVSPIFPGFIPALLKPVQQ
jgi:peptide/nickel transport system substrate-binding protein